MNIKLSLNILVLSIILALIFVPIKSADPEKSTFDTTPGIIYENPKGNSFSEITTGFGLLMAALLIAVLAKSILVYVRIRNQSLLINY